MLFSKIKETLELLSLIYSLSLKKKADVIGISLSIWLGILSLINIELNYKLLLILLTILILFVFYPLFYYIVIFKNVVIIRKKYFFSFDERNFFTSPKLLLNEALLSRFFFTLKMYPPVINEIKKNQNRYSLVIEKSNTVIIQPKKLNDKLNQDFLNFGENNFYCLEQDYENLSNEFKVSLFFNLNNANSVKQIKIYLEYGNFIEKAKADPLIRPQNLINTETIFLSEFD